VEGLRQIDRPTLLERVIRRDQLVVAGALLVAAAIAWLYLLRSASSMYATVSEAAMRATMGMEMSAAPPSGAVEFSSLWLMWTVMMTAMMLASTAPIMLVVLVTYRRRAIRSAALLSVAFIGGYLLIWTLFSAGAAGAQLLLRRAALLSAEMTLSSHLVAASTLVAAGVYQWLPIKDACLAHCWSPLDFIMRHWRDGVGGALGMGARHGAYCVGCCWVLMLLLFVGGVMNLFWVAGITAFVLAERLIRWESWPRRAAGAVLVGWGLLVLAG
jgi:predicted metal-binding membrane protein